MDCNFSDRAFLAQTIEHVWDCHHRNQSCNKTQENQSMSTPRYLVESKQLFTPVWNHLDKLVLLHFDSEEGFILSLDLIRGPSPKGTFPLGWRKRSIQRQNACRRYGHHVIAPNPAVLAILCILVPMLTGSITTNAQDDDSSGVSRMTLESRARNRFTLGEMTGFN